MALNARPQKLPEANEAHVPAMGVNCPCGHDAIFHGVGIGGSSNRGTCDMKGCNCSGFGVPPGQGRGWKYHGEKGEGPYSR